MPSAAPTSAVLKAGSDLGYSATDFITSKNTDITVVVKGTVSGATVTVEATGELGNYDIGSTVATGETTEVTILPTELLDDKYALTVSQIEADKEIAGTLSQGLTLTIDTTPPARISETITGSKRRVTAAVVATTTQDEYLHLVFKGGCSGLGKTTEREAPTGEAVRYTWTFSAPKGTRRNCTYDLVDRAGNAVADIPIADIRVRGGGGGGGGVGIRSITAPSIPTHPPSRPTTEERPPTTTAPAGGNTGGDEESARLKELAKLLEELLALLIEQEQLADIRLSGGGGGGAGVRSVTVRSTPTYTPSRLTQGEQPTTATSAGGNTGGGGESERLKELAELLEELLALLIEREQRSDLPPWLTV